ncbi:MAG: hypothetical protein CME65_05100 [Halobacteriovoraceae bacterium]|nr:hypothetical protein [Halobacteriovoraceae bacterium]|tara:strand:+ start:15008 stop:15268 length:261 start_codon:yes stop_codon:yes gene_type:complete
MMKILYPLLFLFLFSCASTPEEKLRSDLLEENISLGAVLNLGATSFIKGCLFGTQTHAFEKVKPSKFEYCKAAAGAHQEELKTLLE